VGLASLSTPPKSHQRCASQVDGDCTTLHPTFRRIGKLEFMPYSHPGDLHHQPEASVTAYGPLLCRAHEQVEMSGSKGMMRMRAAMTR
jgi:hypothetical protein